MERELFGRERYHSILEVQSVVDAWVEKYNTMRAHRVLGGKTPRPTPRCSRKRRRTTRVVGADESAYQHCAWTSRNHPSPVPEPGRINQ